MMKLRINPLVVADLENIKGCIAEDSEEKAFETLKHICESFEYIQQSPTMGTDLSKNVSFITDCKGVLWEDYMILYKIVNDVVEIYTVDNIYHY